MKSILRSALPKSLVTVLRGRREGLRFLTHRHPKLGLATKLRMLSRFEDVNRYVQAEHSEPEILQIINTMVDLDRRGAQGVVVECGAYLGASTCKLSIVAKQLGRELHCFDSFAGLPESAQYRGNWGRGVAFRQGDYASDYDTFLRTLEAVGERSVTTVTKGWFSDTLPGFTKPVQLVLIDVDLVSSTEDCIRAIWPRVVKSGVFFSHDGHVDEIAEMLGDAEFWRRTCNAPLPTLHGLKREKLVMGQK